MASNGDHANQDAPAIAIVSCDDVSLKLTLSRKLLVTRSLRVAVLEPFLKAFVKRVGGCVHTYSQDLTVEAGGVTLDHACNAGSVLAAGRSTAVKIFLGPKSVRTSPNGAYRAAFINLASRPERPWHLPQGVIHHGV